MFRNVNKTSPNVKFIPIKLSFKNKDSANSPSADPYKREFKKLFFRHRKIMEGKQ